MLKVMIVLYKRPDMSRDEFSEYWHGPHAAITKEWPGVRRYFQNHVLPELPLGDPPCDGIAELWFDNQDVLLSSLGSAEAQRTLTDLANFADTERTKPVIVDQRVVIELQEATAIG